MKPRLLYPDICKFIAIFAVTMGHCSQAISGEQYSNVLGGSGLLIAFHMPLFMLLSGWFLNFDKIRNTHFGPFIIEKAKRLLLPSITWCLIYHLLSFHIPSLSTLLFFYWFLSILFCCHLLLFFLSKIIKNDFIVCLFCVLLSIFIFHENLCRINFMMPFIVCGYYIRQYIESQKYSNFILVLSVILSCFFAFFWDVKYSVYEQPFIITSVNSEMCFAYIYRLLIGLSISVAIVCLVSKISQQYTITKLFARLGNMTLVLYTFSFVLNALFSKIFIYFDCRVNSYFIIDVLSVVLTLIICAFTYILVSVCRKNKYMKLIICGEFN